MHLFSRRRAGLLLAFATGALGTVGCLALEPATPLARLARQSWTIENGLPQNTVSVLGQSRSGFLWAGTELGLARFDGVTFRVFDHSTVFDRTALDHTIATFPDAEIRCLLDAKDGTLWVGTGDGLVRWKDGRSTVMTNHDGLPSNSIRGLTETTDGAVWAWTELGLARWGGESGPEFKAVRVVDGLPGGTLTSVASDGSGGLWVATTSGVAVNRRGRWQGFPEAMQRPGSIKDSLKDDSLKELMRGNFLVSAVSGGDVLVSTPEGVFLEQGERSTLALSRAMLPEDGVNFLARLAGGAVVVASKTTVVVAFDANGHFDAHPMTRIITGKQLPGSRIESIYADREGCLWIGTNHGLARYGLARDAAGSQVQLLPQTDPLAVISVVSFLEDSEGDLWVGTETAGLHIFRDAKFRVIGASDGLSSDATTAIVQDAHGVVWIGTREGGLNRLDQLNPNVRVTNLTTANGLLSNIILALAAAPNGDLWVGTPDGLNRIHQNKITSFTSADGLPDDFIRSLLVEPDNSLWIGTRRGLTHLDPANPAQIKSYTHRDGLGSDLVGALARAANGDLWIATLNGLSQLHEGVLHNYTTIDGLSSNVITALDIGPNGSLWIGTQDAGLNLWNGQHFTAVALVGLPTAIHAILHDDVEQEVGGYLWLASNAGLSRVSIPPLLKCANCSLDVMHFTTADGLRSRETSNNSHPTACRTREGALWFATPRGVAIANPEHFLARLVTPPTAIERFAVDDDEVAITQASERPQIAAGHVRFEFDYAGLSFASTQKLRYQYILEGFDHAWIDAGARRTAYYTNIPPGHYTFRVRATLGDIAFPKNASDPPLPETSLSFELRPHFYQTFWFYSLLALLGALLLFLFVRILYRRRLQRVQREFGAVMAERNRIAREIHDTLAQGYVGISLQLEVLGELLRHNRAEAAAKHLTLTQDYVREGLDDARQSIWALRSHDAGEQTLPVRLRRLVEQAQDSELASNLEVHGAYRALKPDAEKELLRIAQEAIHNVKKHAQATRMTARLDYDERMVALTITDNGKGFSVSGLNAQNGSHYGFTGMRERTALIEGHLQITSEPGAGTTVHVEAPALAGSNSNASFSAGPAN
jgi:signal transduction histidine kinase/ligand-binding sensor domain-containing protein